MVGSDLTGPLRQRLEAAWVVPVRPRGQVLADHSVVLEGDRIAAVLPTEDARQCYPDAEGRAFPGHVLLPGLINMHTHSPMTLLRGVADDLPLQTWLNDHIWPLEGAFMSREFVRDGSELAMAEMLRGGTTCFNENYFFPDTIASVAQRVGMRATVGLPVINFETAWASDEDAYFRRGLELHQTLRGDPLVRTAFAPHAPYSVSMDGLRRIGTLAEEMDVPIHIHLHESAWDIEIAMQNDGMRGIDKLDRLNMLSPRLLAVHMTQLNDSEIDRCAESGVHVIHCPDSNLKLASGFCPVARLQAAGINVAVGTDGAASNNDLDLLAEVRSAALLAKCLSGKPGALPAEAALDTVTMNAARALGREQELGSLEPGKLADVIAMDLSAPETQPLHDVVSQVIYAASRRQVTDVWVAGRALLRDGELTTLDLQVVLDKAADWQQRMAARRASGSRPEDVAVAE